MENTKTVSSNNKISDGTQADPLSNSDEVNANVDEITDIFNKVSKVAQDIGQWSESTVQLFFMESLEMLLWRKNFLFANFCLFLYWYFLFSVYVSV